MARILPATPEAIAEAVAALRAGQLVAFPTETVYGLGAAARDAAAVERIFELKRRPRDHPLIVHLPGPAALGEWAVASELAYALARHFWPGPLTLVLQRSELVPAVVTGGQATVALRVPRHPVAEALLTAFGDGVAAPSANRFGRISPTRAEHVASEFGEELLVLDGGPSEVGLESTILDLSGAQGAEGVRLLRPGGVPVAVIEEFIGQRVLLPDDLRARERTAVPRVSGSLASHYAARAPSELVTAEALAARALAGGQRVAVLALMAAPEGFAGEWLQLPSDPVRYGQRLYSALRQLDSGEPARILIEAVPDNDEWLAVRDRLTRATARSNA